MWFLNLVPRQGAKRVIKMEDFMKIVLWLIAIMMGTFLVECRDSVLHRVGGGRYAWAPHINFAEWSSHEQFYVGDWLCKFLLLFFLSV